MPDHPQVLGPDVELVRALTQLLETATAVRFEPAREAAEYAAAKAVEVTVLPAVPSAWLPEDPDA